MSDENYIFEVAHYRQMALDAAKGLTYLHAAGVIHRDLKCGNLLVDRDWNVKGPYFFVKSLECNVLLSYIWMFCF